MRASHGLSLLALALLTACRPAATPQAAAPAASPTAADASARDVATVAEAFLTPMTPEDNIDSPASWTTPEGQVWLIATAKATDKLVVYDGQTGAKLRDVGSLGTAPGQFDRPNGIAVVDDLVLIVERDNHRVQVLQLPDFSPLGVFGADDLRKPYGLWVNKQGNGYDVYVTDSYDAGEDAQGNDVLPPLAELDKRVRRYALQVQGDSPPWRPVSVFDDGRRVYVVFPAGIVQGEMPPIFVLGTNGEPQIVNSRVHQNVLIVDRLFGAAELRLGSGNRQQVVRIVRINPTQATTAQPASAAGDSPS